MIVLSFLNVNGYPIDSLDFTEVNLRDDIVYVRYYVENINQASNSPASLFDADLNTCWNARSDDSDQYISIFIQLPDIENYSVLNIVSGKVNDETSFYNYARLRKIQLALYVGVNPEAWVSEKAITYKAVRSDWEKTIVLPDSCSINSLALDYLPEKLNLLMAKVTSSYNMHYDHPIGTTTFILRIDFLSTYSGTMYSEVCISEIFFNDRFVRNEPAEILLIDEVYVSPDGTALLVDSKEDREVVIYEDESSVLQLIDVSQNNSWAVLISMPAQIAGRTETEYLLVDLLNEEVVNMKLERVTGNYISGNSLYFECPKSNILNYLANDGNYYSIELR